MAPEKTTTILIIITAVVIGWAFVAMAVPHDEAAPAGVSWREYPLTDLMSGNTVTVGGLAADQGPVLLQTYATWCSSCAWQLEEMKKLQDQRSEPFTLLILSPDPNESPAAVRTRIAGAGLDAVAVIAPPEFTRAVVAEIGTAPFETYPSLVLIDEEGDARIVSIGSRSAATIDGILSG
jgi:hypothetical protein